jgi:hypothetical protein
MGALRLGKCAEALGLLPDQLPADFFDRFRAWQRDNSWRPNSDKVVRNACTAWNRLVRTGRVAGAEVQLPEKAVIHPPLSDYPESFETEVKSDEAYQRDPATWCRKRPACRYLSRPYKDETVARHRAVLRILAGSLVASGFP